MKPFSLAKACVVMVFVRVLYLVSFASCHTIQDVTNVHEMLFQNSSYNRNVRGVTDQTMPVRVQANLSLLGLGQVMEREEAFQVNAVLHLQWQDDRLVWYSSDYNGTSEVVVYQDTIWKPEVKLGNNVFEVKALGDERTQIKIYSTGMVSWIIPDMFQATCSVNVVSFPWDRQSCSLNFIVSTFTPDEVTIESGSDMVYTDQFEESESWKVMETKPLNLTSQVQFWVCLERRPSFHISVIFLPIVFLSILNVFVYLIPVESGERISFSITLLLSITLYLSMISDNLPTHSRSMSAIIYCLMFVLTESTVICFMSILSLYICHKPGQPSPTLQGILLKLHSKGTCKVRDTADAHVADEAKDEELHDVKGDVHKLDYNPNTGFNWLDVSNVIDRISICISSFAIVIVFIIFSIHVSVGRMECT